MSFSVALLLQYFISSVSYSGCFWKTA